MRAINADQAPLACNSPTTTSIAPPRRITAQAWRRAQPNDVIARLADAAASRNGNPKRAILHPASPSPLVRTVLVTSLVAMATR